MWKAMRFVALVSLVGREVGSASTEDGSAFEGINLFALRLLDNTFAYQENFVAKNFAICPISLWNLYALLAEASSGVTFKELMSVLQLPDDLRATQALHLAVKDILNKNNRDVTLKGEAAIFADRSLSIDQDFCEVASLYKTDVFSVDVRNTTKLAEDINEFICKATDGWIKDSVKPKFLEKLRMVLVDALFFKANWTVPFDPTQTRKGSFFNYQGKPIGEVNMMQHKGQYQIQDFPLIAARILELPYGTDEKFSMLILLPYDGIPLKVFLNHLASKSTQFLKKFRKQKSRAFVDDKEEIEVMIPRFKISSQLDLIPPMHYIGIISIFDQRRAELPGISAEKLHVSRTIQNVEIEVSEQGTVAAAATVIGVEDRTLPEKFQVNKEFVFLITEKKSNVILFAGVYNSPSVW